MKLLLVAATRAEVNLVADTLSSKNYTIDLLITGVGMVATAFSLGKHFTANNYDLALNAGIAGSFNRNIKTGEVVQVQQDCFSELGAEDGADFIPINQLGFGECLVKPFPHAMQIPALASLRTVTGITVNKVHGSEETIKETVNRLHPDIESMEGAAFFYACNQANIPSVQIRSISNFVERRNRDNWDIGLAVRNLDTFLRDLINEIK
ncbi:futalosine hydrolase [Rubrolithibacter danxiaensis]|uniref:futalosine hydrolase n=1 Tax=Rubrolithibacter danxiaensis TaxID=3390805 RepID=UPI003BF918BA